MKFMFEIEIEDARKVRAMLMRGFYAFQAEKLKEAQYLALRALGPQPTGDDFEMFQIDAEVNKRLAAEEKAWKEMLLTFERF